MILAAGVGSRLDPLTRAIPKPMVPIVNRPVIEHIVLDLKKHGFTEIMINLHYLGDVIQQALGDGARLGVQISYAQEDKLWGDAGSVKRSQAFFGGETFLVVGGDDISDIDLTGLMLLHQEKNAAATIATTVVEDPSQFGIVVTDEDGRIARFLEKPKSGSVFSNTANTGIYVFEPQVFDLIPPDTFWGFGNNVFPQLLAEDRPLYGFATTSYWQDVGSLQVYRQTNFDALSGRVHLNLPLTQGEEGIWLGDGVEIDPSAEIGSPVAIGHGVTIGAGAKILENTIIADGCFIEPDVTLKDTILWAGARISRGTHLERCVVGTNVQVQSNAAIFDANIVDPTRRMTAKT
ncbi:MAG: NDP-sugar synthase [Armatimonadota bacterium]|nr:NDP-sugar synthase [Armatimonadota bacterium]